MSLWDFSTFGGTPKADRPKLILSKPPPLVSFFRCRYLIGWHSFFRILKNSRRHKKKMVWAKKLKVRPMVQKIHHRQCQKFSECQNPLFLVRKKGSKCHLECKSITVVMTHPKKDHPQKNHLQKMTLLKLWNVIDSKLNEYAKNECKKRVSGNNQRSNDSCDMSNIVWLIQADYASAFFIQESQCLLHLVKIFVWQII